MKKEAKLTTIFRKWALSQFPQLYPQETIVIEVKQCLTSIAFSAVKEHQELALWTAKHKLLYHKIPDCGYQNPFDIVSISGALSFVVIYYAETKTFYFIDIDTYQNEKALSKRKSLSCKRAEEISTRTVSLQECRRSHPLP